MRNLLFRISYNGANYHGYQVQANAAVAASSHPPAPAGSLMAGAVRHFGQKRRDGT